MKELKRIISMKCSGLFHAVFMVLIAATASAQTGSFTINGTIGSGVNITTLYFAHTSFYESGSLKAIRIPVNEGKFTISGNIQEPGPAFLSLTADFKPKDPSGIKQFILEHGDVSVSIQATIASARIEGSKANDDAARYTMGQAPHVAEIRALNDAIQFQNEQGVPVDSIVERYHRPLKQAGKKLLDYQYQFVSENPEAFISLLLVAEIARSTHNYFEADSLFDYLWEGIKMGSTAEKIQHFINSQKKTSIGAPAPEFSLADTAGKSVALSSTKGNYVLLDFWAAWCKPCRDENPNIVRAYHRYKDRGFTVFGVSLDRDRKTWLKAIKDDELSWQQVSDLKFWMSKAAILYGVGSIPRNFLLDPEGRIIGRDLRGPDLNDKLEELLGK